MLRFLYLFDEHVRTYLDYLIHYWPSLDVCEGPHLSSPHGVSMKGDIIEIYLAGLRGEAVFRKPLKERLDKDRLALPTIYQHLIKLCTFVQFLDACLITRYLKSNGVRVYKLFPSSEFESDEFVQYWIHGDKAQCLQALFSGVGIDTSTD